MKIRTGIEKLGKGMILLIFSIFTIFPFVWMILSALKTKAEIMDVSSFFPAEFQWHNFYQVIFESPLLRYVGNSLFVSVITLALQIVTGAMIAYAIIAPVTICSASVITDTNKLLPTYRRSGDSKMTW